MAEHRWASFLNCAREACSLCRHVAGEPLTHRRRSIEDALSSKSTGTLPLMLLVVTTECVLAASVFSFTAERAVATPTMSQRNRHSICAMAMATSRHQPGEPRFWTVLRSKDALHHCTPTGYLEYHGPTSGFASERMLASTPIAQDACYHGPTSQVGAQRFDCPRLD